MVGLVKKVGLKLGTCTFWVSSEIIHVLKHNDACLIAKVKVQSCPKNIDCLSFYIFKG